MKFVLQMKRASINLFRAKMRTVLAMMGIIVGTASVVALLSSGKLATETALNQFRSLGINLVSVSMYFSQQNTRKIKQADLKELPTQVPEIHIMAPYLVQQVQGSVDSNFLNSINVIATTEEMAHILNIRMQNGRFISNLDKSQYFCVVGQKMLEKMKVLLPLGLHVKLNQAIFTVIGTLDNWKENGLFYYDINESVIIPLKTADAFFENNTIDKLMVLLYPETDVIVVKEKIAKYFYDRFPGITVDVRTAKELINGIKVQQGIFTLLLGFIGGISLVVGGIGVANIMLASVTERKFEIGLRLAIGAQPQDIQLMFLMEAAVLGIVGGTIGVAIGLLSTLIIALFAGWTFSFFWFPSFIGFLVSLIITLFFGYYPALVASRINPINALKGI